VTCKIQREAIGEDQVILRVSGHITGEDVSTLKALLEQESGVLILNLKNVRLVDGDAVKLLATHEANGVTISECPPYVREWIRLERKTSG